MAAAFELTTRDGDRCRIDRDGARVRLVVGGEPGNKQYPALTLWIGAGGDLVAETIAEEVFPDDTREIFLLAVATLFGEAVSE